MNQKEIQKVEKELFGAFPKDKVGKQFDVHTSLLKMWEQLDGDELRLRVMRGAILFVWYEMKYFELAGYDNFKDFCNSGELGIRFGYFSASRYLAVYRFLYENFKDMDDVLKYVRSWSQLTEMLPAIAEGKVTKDNFVDTLEDTKALTSKDVREYMNEMRGKTSNPQNFTPPTRLCAFPAGDPCFPVEEIELSNGEKWLGALVQKIV